jgi:cyclic pyranopterin monophosphate synthase
MSELSHVAAGGGVRMVDVGGKDASLRTATAQATVRFHDAATLDRLRAADVAKGNVLDTARVAGIMAAKRTAELIPLCHPLPLDHAAVDFELLSDPPGLRIVATARCHGVTGVEMEALTAVSIAALTVIDMLKSIDRWITVDGIGLMEKDGGRHGRLVRPQPAS